jgi:hypothetical protein
MPNFSHPQVNKLNNTIHLMRMDDAFSPIRNFELNVFHTYNFSPAHQ